MAWMPMGKVRPKICGRLWSIGIGALAAAATEARIGLVVTSVPKVTLRKANHFKALCHAFWDCLKSGGQAAIAIGIGGYGSLAG
jgi:hypothetical protein